MKMQALVFIHPIDFDKLLKGSAGPIDMLIYNLEDSLPVNELDGIVFRQTFNVPAVITADWDESESLEEGN